jgi:hypothetical protein
LFLIPGTFHFDEDGKPFFVEMPKAGKVIPLIVESLAKKK